MSPDNHNLLLPMFSPMAQPPGKRYRTIVADPPWGAVARSPIRFNGKKTATNDYATMTNEEITGLPIGMWAAEDSHLYLWALNNNLPAAHRILTAWGFDFKTLITWVKGRFEHGRLVHHFGLGQYFRNSTEHVLFGTRGSAPIMNHDTPTAFVAPRTDHSEKPATFYDMVEHVSPGPYLDVFARKQRMGWDCFGNEAYNPSELLATLTDEQSDGLVPA